MTKKELMDVVKPFLNTIDFTIEVEGMPYNVGIQEAKYTVDGHRQEHIVLVPAAALKVNMSKEVV